MEHNQQTSRGGVRTVSVDVVVAVLIFLAGALVAWDSYRLGAAWGSDGPQSGYFPFYIGLITCICGLVVFVHCLSKLRSDHGVFVTSEQFKQVLVIFVPSTLYVLGVQLVGIYGPSAVFISLFMRIVGKYTWLRSTLVGVAVSASSFVMFEIWFKIPLPKGPLENLLGY